MKLSNLLARFTLTFLVCSAFGSGSLPIREAPITLLFEFDRLSPKPDKDFFRRALRYLDTDHQRCAYIVDKQNHRVLKYTEGGEFVAQIGSIGKDAPDFYYPLAIRVSGDHIYVADGKTWIKKYTLDGQFVSRIESGHPSGMLFCLDVERDRVFGNVLKFSRDFNRNALMTVLDSNGKTAAEFGDVLKCQNVYAHLTFNKTHFSVVDGNLIGAFERVPIIFKYTTSGEKIYQKDLRELDLDIVRRVAEEAARAKIYDTPERHITQREGLVLFANYCRGFDVDEASESYYSVGGELGIPPVIYRFDGQGIPREVIRLKLGENDVATVGIFINRGLKTRYGVGYVLERTTAYRPFFFKF